MGRAAAEKINSSRFASERVALVEAQAPRAPPPRRRAAPCRRRSSTRSGSAPPSSRRRWKRRDSTSYIEAKSSLGGALDLEGAVLAFRPAAVEDHHRGHAAVPWMCEMSKHSIRRGTSSRLSRLRSAAAHLARPRPLPPRNEGQAAFLPPAPSGAARRAAAGRPPPPRRSVSHRLHGRVLALDRQQDLAGM